MISRNLTSSQILFETNNLENNTYVDNNFKIGSRNDRLSSLDDLTAHGLQEFDGYEEPHAYYRKSSHCNLDRALYK